MPGSGGSALHGVNPNFKKKEKKNKCPVGITAGSLGHWVVNKESNMVVMLLRSC